MSGEPDATAVLVALWRTRHLELDDPPHVYADTLAVELVGPPTNWREQPTMSPRSSADRSGH